MVHKKKSRNAAKPRTREDKCAIDKYTSKEWCYKCEEGMCLGKMEEMEKEKNKAKFLTVELLQSSVNGQERVGTASLRDLSPALVR